MLANLRCTRTRHAKTSAAVDYCSHRCMGMACAFSSSLRLNLRLVVTGRPVLAVPPRLLPSGQTGSTPPACRPPCAGRRRLCRTYRYGMGVFARRQGASVERATCCLYYASDCYRARACKCLCHPMTVTGSRRARAAPGALVSTGPPVAGGGVEPRRRPRCRPVRRDARGGRRHCGAVRPRAGGGGAAGGAE